MPRELHRPYARCLSEIRVRLDLDSEDAELLAPIRQHARFYAGSRLLAWLETPRAAAAITRHFLGKPDATTLDPVALARTSADLDKDQAATSALSSARRRQKALEAVPPRRGRGRAAEPELRNAPLVLRRSDQYWSLAIKLPQMEDGLRATTREALDALRWRALFWGQGRPVAARSLFSDHPIPISCIELPPPSAPILADLADLPIALDAQLFLGSLRIQSGLPLLFTDADATGDYHQLLTAAATIDRRYVLIAADGAPLPPHAVQRLGRVAGCQVLGLDTADEEIRIWLSRLGIVVREYASFAWLGAPEIEQHRPVRRFCVGDLLVFETRRSSGLSNKVTILDPDKIETTVNGDDHLIAAFTPTTHGRNSIDYGGDELMAFDVVDTPEQEMLLSMRLEASLGSIGKLVSKSVALRFESSWSVQEVDLEVRITSHGPTLARATTILPDTPCRIPADHAIWADLVGRGCTGERRPSARYLSPRSASPLLPRPSGQRGGSRKRPRRTDLGS
jgi:hypothetical protein